MSPISIVFSVIALGCAILAIFYWTQSTGLLASAHGHHPLHALAFTAAAVVFVLGAAFTARRPL